MSANLILDPSDPEFVRDIALLFLNDVKSRGLKAPLNFDSTSRDYNPNSVVKFLTTVGDLLAKESTDVVRRCVERDEADEGADCSRPRELAADMAERSSVHGIITADRAEKSSIPEELAADIAERSSIHGILTADRAEKSSVPEELAADMAERKSSKKLLPLINKENGRKIHCFASNSGSAAVYIEAGPTQSSVSTLNVQYDLQAVRRGFNSLDLWE
ncbi:hypothetical protein QYM36_008407, partial [Artemia franciscana]